MISTWIVSHKLLRSTATTSYTSWSNNSVVGGEDLKITCEVIQGTPHLLIESGWWELPDGGRSHGNWNWIITPTENPPLAPEPMTSALFGLGALAGAVGSRVRRKFSRSA